MLRPVGSQWPALRYLDIAVPETGLWWDAAHSLTSNILNTTFGSGELCVAPNRFTRLRTLRLDLSGNPSIGDRSVLGPMGVEPTASPPGDVEHLMLNLSGTRLGTAGLREMLQQLAWLPLSEC